jgi:hypothetical protein
MRLTLVDGQRGDVIDVALHDPLEPVADADDVDAFDPGADGGRADDAVDAGRGTAPDEDGDVLVMIHGRGVAYRLQYLRGRARQAARE